METSAIIAIAISAFTSFALGLVMYMIKIHWSEIKLTQADVREKNKDRVESVKEVHGRIDTTNDKLTNHITDSRVHTHSQ